MKISRINELPDDLEDLLKQSQRAGFRFLGRMVDEFLSDQNRFDAPGEGLYELRDTEGVLRGIGGITRITSELFRLRRVYVDDDVRGRGVGRRLIAALEDALPDGARVLELTTDTRAAAAFYERLGYRRCDSARRSHLKVLGDQ